MMAATIPYPHFLNPFGTSAENGPLFVFLPGMDETGQALIQLQMKGLETLFDVRCFVVPAPIFSRWDLLSNRVIQLIQAELDEAPRQVYLCGESFGGCIALKVLEQAPELCDRIILINPASFPACLCSVWVPCFYPGPLA